MIPRGIFINIFAFFKGSLKTALSDNFLSICQSIPSMAIAYASVISYVAGNSYAEINFLFNIIKIQMDAERDIFTGRITKRRLPCTSFQPRNHSHLHTNFMT